MKTVQLAALLLVATATLCAGAAEPEGFQLGTPEPVSQIRRSIVIGPDTKWANVMYDEAVNFVVGETRFGWRFDGPGARTIDLQKIAPPGVVNRPVLVYVTRGLDW